MMKNEIQQGLTVQSLSASFGSKAVLRNLSFNAASGTVVALLGANGSGKTTLLRSIGGLLNHDGMCMLNGQRLENLSAAKRAALIGFCASQPVIPPDITCLETVLTGLSTQLGLFRKSSPEQDKEALRLLSLMGLDHVAGKELRTLSDGQQRLVLLARALIHRPSLLLLDEPDGPLDIQHRGTLMKLLREIAADTGCTVLLASHDVNGMLAWADRFLLLKNGEMSAEMSCRGEVKDSLQAALSDVYGPVRLLENGDSYLMVSDA